MHASFTHSNVHTAQQWLKGGPSVKDTSQYLVVIAYLQGDRRELSWVGPVVQLVVEAFLQGEGHKRTCFLRTPTYTYCRSCTVIIHTIATGIEMCNK